MESSREKVDGVDRAHRTMLRAIANCRRATGMSGYDACRLYLRLIRAEVAAVEGRTTGTAKKMFIRSAFAAMLRGLADDVARGTSEVKTDASA